MKSSPLIARQNSIRAPLTSQTTPKKRPKGSGSKNKSPLSNSSISCSSRKGSSKRINVREMSSYETFHKDLLDYQTTCVNNSLDSHGITNQLKFTETGNESIARKSLLKCKNHDDEYNFFSIDDKKFLCNKCLYNKYEKLIPGSWKSSVLPIDKCSELINRENTHFLEIECPQYFRHLQRTISICNHNNNLLVQKQEVFQGIIATEFNNLYQQLKKREEELTEHITTFFDQIIKENIHQLQNFKFLLDNIHKLREFGKYKSLEQNVIQFSFASKLKKVLENIDLNVPKLASKDLDIIGMVTKEKVKKEIDKLGKPLTKCLEALVSAPKINSSLKSPSESVSPIKVTRTNHRTDSIPKSQRKSSSIGEKKEQSIILKQKPSSEYIRIKELEALASTDLTQLLSTEAHPFDDSNILADHIIREEALGLFPISVRKTKKLYCMSRDGASSQVFHQRCDGYAPYLVLVKTEGKHVFGYYSPLKFMSNDKYCGLETFWIFSLKNMYNRGVIFKIKPEKNFIALYNSSKSPCLGSTIKGKEDLYIDFDNLGGSCSNIGYAYKLWDSKIEGSKVLSGKASGWTFDEIEVYQIEE